MSGLRPERVVCHVRPPLTTPVEAIEHHSVMTRTRPICGRSFTDGDDPPPPRPFCSVRCKMVDLGNWLDEAYRVPVNGEWEKPDTSRDDDPDPGPGLVH